jgi:hypothetical protein
MDPSRRKQLEQLACQRRDATAHDDERWSFLFNTEGSVGFSYCPWSYPADDEFDGSDKRLCLPWKPERLQLLSSGQAEPTDEELRQWREARCRILAQEGRWFAYIVPLEIDEQTAGYALFVGFADGDPDEVPILKGVFDSFPEAKAALAAEGSIA